MGVVPSARFFPRWIRMQAERKVFTRWNILRRAVKVEAFLFPGRMIACRIVKTESERS